MIQSFTTQPVSSKQGYIRSMSDLVRRVTLGGEGSGNFGHAGRPGEVGGSGSGGGGSLGNWKPADGYQEFESHPEYQKFEKGLEGKYVKMSPDEYLQKSYEGFGTTRDRTSMENMLATRDKSRVYRYASDMKKGDKFPAPVLDYSHGFTQEGIHRAMAAKEAGIKEMPVLVVKKVKPTPQEYLKYYEDNPSVVNNYLAAKIKQEHGIK